MTYTRILPEWHGVGWLPLIVAAVLLGRFVFHRKPDLRSVMHPALPFYTPGYALILSMIFISRRYHRVNSCIYRRLGLVSEFSGIVKAGLVVVSGLLAGHLALFTYFAIEPSGRPESYLCAAVSWGHLGHGLVGSVLWTKPEGRRLITGSCSSATGRFRSWCSHFWTVLAGRPWRYPDFKTGILVATGNAVLAGILAMMWLSSPGVGLLGFLMLAIGSQLVWLGYQCPL
jgi:hypothetical protein